MQKDYARRVLPQDDGLISFASNDYLGLEEECGLKEEFLQTRTSFAFSSNSSRLLSVKNKEFSLFESTLEKAYLKSALLFNSAYCANTGVISTLALDKNTFFLCDKKIHASVIDALKTTNFKRFFHNDIDHARKIALSNKDKNIILISEGLFSMDGDLAPLKEMILLKKELSNLKIYLDEAHSFGVLGSTGLGLCEEYMSEVDFVILGFGKALCSVGGAVLCEKDFKQNLVNKARSFIYTTALPPLNTAWSHFVFKKLPFFKDKREKLRKLCEFAKGLESSLRGELCIQTLACKDNSQAVRLSKHLAKKGFFVPAIRPPTVQHPCLRLSINASMNEDLIKEVLDEIKLFNKK